MPGVQSFRHSYPSHSFQKQIKGAGFPGNITVPKVMVKPMIKRLKTCKNVIILHFPSVNATSTSAGVSWRLRCIERLIWVVSSRDNYRYGDLSLLLVYPAAALKVGQNFGPRLFYHGFCFLTELWIFLCIDKKARKQNQTKEQRNKKHIFNFKEIQANN